MSPRLTALYSRLGRFDKLFLLLLVLYLGWTIVAPGAPILALLGFLVYLLGLIEGARLLRWWVRKAIWRLRNRLILAYVFIAFVPIVLVVALASLAIYALTGGVASYLVSSELDRRIAALENQARFLAGSEPEARGQLLVRLPALWRERYPNLEVLVRDQTDVRYPPNSTLSPPAAANKDISGIVMKDGLIYLWAYVQRPQTRVVLLAPLDHDYLASLVPSVGDAFFLNASDVPATESKSARKTVRLDLTNSGGGPRVPPKYNRFDVQIAGVAPLRMAHWEQPHATDPILLVVHTRTSAVLRTVYGQTSMAFGQGVLAAFVLISIVFLVVEIVSLVVGVSITRNITGAVHVIYEGTERVREGNFSHRILVKGNDQLAQLGHSFNRMTEDLERLFVVQKEKERLESELTIAREVQEQLFPKAIPEARTIRLAGVCHPARMVSGDYYDFLPVERGLGLAIGDVAGKGISAALLMAAIQSTMRTQLSAGAVMAAAANNGAAHAAFSTAQLVSQLNRQLYLNTSPEKYATFYFGLYDDTNGILTYTNAGHLPPLLLRNGSPQPLEVTGTVVGAFPFSRYEEKTVTLQSGDLLVAYTDGVVEPENEYGEQFGEQRLADLLVKHGEADNNEIIARVMEAVQGWTGSTELQDDMTMVVARRI
jgi:sigma-B regulation protein RsbU (phosphoserine phosphatase)